MRALIVMCVMLGGAAATAATVRATWSDYIKANRYICPGPFDTLKETRELKLGGKTYSHKGYRLEVKDPDPDSKIVLGVLSAIKDVAAPTQENLQRTFAWFKEKKVEWVIVNGDVALEEFALEEVIDLIAAPGFPVLVTLGNSESKGSFARVYADREAKWPNLVNGVFVRQLIADDAELWTLPGYHDKRFVHQGNGCLYKPEDLDAMAKALTPAGKNPVVLVSHGPPKGQGALAMDYMADKVNVGDEGLNNLIEKKKIAFGLFGHILEAGGVAVGKEFGSLVKPNTPVTSLYLNAGSVSGDPWGQNDGSTSTGMAFVVTIDGDKAKYEVLRLTPKAEEEE